MRDRRIERNCAVLPTPMVYRHISNDIKLWLLDADYLTEVCEILGVSMANMTI
jgi:hypothetical protein